MMWRILPTQRDPLGEHWSRGDCDKMTDSGPYQSRTPSRLTDLPTVRPLIYVYSPAMSVDCPGHTIRRETFHLPHTVASQLCEWLIILHKVLAFSHPNAIFHPISFLHT